MTSACIEYWLLLHYELYSPPVQTVAEKKQIMNKLLKFEANYKKGNSEITAKIAQHYPTAVKNSKKNSMPVFNRGNARFRGHRRTKSVVMSKMSHFFQCA